MPEALPGRDHHLIRYIKFISSIEERPKKQRINFELHHIIPKSLGGLDIKDNLISLTPREHFVAHMMLWKAYEGPMIYAFWQMSNCNNLKMSSRLYETLRKDFREQARINQSGINNRKEQTEEERRKRSETITKWWAERHLNEVFNGKRKSLKNKPSEKKKMKPHSEEHRKNLSESLKGKPKSEEHKANIRKAIEQKKILQNAN